jgi:hypothetical protein
VKELRRKQQIKHQAEYEQKLVSEKQLIKNWRGGHMKEETGDEVWIPYCNTTNIFSTYLSVLADIVLVDHLRVAVVGSQDPVYLTQQNVMSFVNECAFT